MSPSTPSPREPVGRAPRGTPPVVPAVVLVVLALVALAVVAVHDLAVARSWTTGEAWVPALLDALDGLSASPLTTAVGIAAAIAGLALVVAAVRPAPRTHRASAGEEDLWVSDRAVGALARSAADRSAGVLAARVRRSTARAVVLEVQATQDGPALATHVEEALRPRLAALVPVRVDVRAQEVPR